MKHPPGLVKPQLKNRILLRMENHSPTICYNSVFTFAFQLNLHLNVCCRCRIHVLFLRHWVIFIQCHKGQYCLYSLIGNARFSLKELNVPCKWLISILSIILNDTNSKYFTFLKLIFNGNYITVTRAIRQLYFDKLKDIMGKGYALTQLKTRQVNYITGKHLNAPQ